jgi:hypothetical protein
MFKFRAQKIDNKEWIEGYHVFDKFVNKHYLQIPVDDDFDDYFEVIPETLSMSTGQLDKNGTMIFSSFEVDGKITVGGDVVKLHYGIPPTSDILVIEFVDNQVFNDFYVSGFWMRNLNKNRHSASLHKEYQNDLEIIGKQSEAI